MGTNLKAKFYSKNLNDSNISIFPLTWHKMLILHVKGLQG
jgi:hypothetical protein